MLEILDTVERIDWSSLASHKGDPEVERARLPRELDADLQRADLRLEQYVVEQDDAFAATQIHCPGSSRSNADPNPDTTADRDFPSGAY